MKSIKPLESFEPKKGDRFWVGFTGYEILTRVLEDRYKAKVIDILKESRHQLGETRTIFRDALAERVQTKKEKEVSIMESVGFAIEILEGNLEGLDYEDKRSYLEDVTSHGCQSGAVSGVIYYHETDKLFKENFEEIFNLLDEMRENTDADPLDGYNYEDIPNYSVWIAVEVTAGNMLNELELEAEEQESY